MLRANRHYIPGCIWHITHRCHKQEFLLKFEKDKKRLRHWLFEAKKRYGLSVLNYIVMSNHIHLLVVDTKEKVIAKSIQLIAGRTGQEFNQRKKRKGAFWEDRYHATAIESGDHLAQCMVYINLNMVRAGVVNHPAEYSLSGFHEIQNPPVRYKIIDYETLANLFNINDEARFRQEHACWVEEGLQKGSTRNGNWSESIALGSEQFIEKIKNSLGVRVMGRSTIGEGESAVLRESKATYNTLFDVKKRVSKP